MPVDLLVTNGIVVTMNQSGDILEDAAVAVDAGRIVGIGAANQYSARQVLDAQRNAVLPGFVDAHMHECLLRGFAEDLPLAEWLDEICFPKDRAYEPHHMRAAALMSQLEMIRGGITTFIDIFRFPDEAAQIAEQSGLRAMFSPQIIETPAGTGETVEQAEAFVRRWKDRVPGRIFPWFGPHAPYSVTADGYRRLRGLADRYGVGIHTHLSETQSEVEQIRRQHGCSPVEYLDRLGVLGPDCLAAHCVHVSESDIEILRNRDVAVAHNPSSNMKLASGIAPLTRLIESGIRVGLGTDSNLSNNNLDMFEEMRLAAMLQKVSTQNAQAISCEAALRMATLGSARCLGLGDEIGSLEVGKRADIILVDLRKPHMWPTFTGPAGNVVEQLVYSANANDVIATFVGGRALMLKGEVKTLDISTAKAIVHGAAVDLLAKASLTIPIRMP
jgi:5-methylthioadenosine/S-adenosylhomocysteine deaminase